MEGKDVTMIGGQEGRLRLSVDEGLDEEFGGWIVASTLRFCPVIQPLGEIGSGGSGTGFKGSELEGESAVECVG